MVTMASMQANVRQNYSVNVKTRYVWQCQIYGGRGGHHHLMQAVAWQSLAP